MASAGKAFEQCLGLWLNGMLELHFSISTKVMGMRVCDDHEKISCGIWYLNLVLPHSLFLLCDSIRNITRLRLHQHEDIKNRAYGDISCDTVQPRSLLFGCITRVRNIPT